MLGALRIKQNTSLLRVQTECLFVFSSRYDLSATMLEDVLIHEMIHLYIFAHRIQDTSPHGVHFRKIMNKINTEWNRNIRITLRLPEPLRQTDNTNSSYYIYVFRLRSRDITCFMRSASTVLQKVYAHLSASPDIEDIQLYCSRDSIFNKYPNARSIKYYLITPPIQSALSKAGKLL